MANYDVTVSLSLFFTDMQKPPTERYIKAYLEDGLRMRDYHETDFTIEEIKEV